MEASLPLKWSTVAFFKDVIGTNPEWLDLEQSQLRERGRLASHFSLNGRQYMPGSGNLLSTGVLSIPDADLRRFGQSVANTDADLYFHEIKSTPNHPYFLDIDMSAPPDHRFFYMARNLIQDARLDVAAIGKSDVFLTHLKIPPIFSLDLHRDDVGFNICVELQKKRDADPHNDFATWMDVIDVCCDATEDSLVGIESQDPRVLRPVVALLLMAISCIVQRVVHTFYPDLPDRDMKLQTVVLTNYADELKRMDVTQDENTRVMKIGAHLYMRMLYVDGSISLYIWQALFDYFCQHFSVVPGGVPHTEFWQKVFDAAPYTNPQGGLRMPFCIKAATCNLCHGRTVERKKCIKCYKSGRLSVPRYYGPLCIVNPDGMVAIDSKNADRLFNRHWVLSMCTVRVASGAKLTPGVVLEEKQEPKNLAELQRASLELTQGAQKAKRIIDKLARDTGVLPNDPDMGHLLSSLSMMNEMYDYTPGKVPRENCRTQMLRTDPRFHAIRVGLPLLAGELFHPCYANMSVESATVVTDGPQGQPISVVVFIRGDAASRCFNRVFDPADSDIACDLPGDVKQVRSDVVDVPGRHTGWKNTVFFVLGRENHGTVTQKCFNKQVKGANRRNARTLGSGASASCASWSGKTMRVGIENKEVIRNMLFRPHEQTDQACRQQVLAEATRLHQRYKGVTAPSVLGPTDNYSTYAGRVLAVMGRKRSKKMPTEADLGEGNQPGYRDGSHKSNRSTTITLAFDKTPI